MPPIPAYNFYQEIELITVVHSLWDCDNEGLIYCYKTVLCSV